MSSIEYKITNITKWPGVQKGKHKHGFILAINRRNLHVGKSMVVPSMTEALEGMQAKRWLKVEAVKDRHVLVKEQVAKTEAENKKELEALKEKTELEAAGKAAEIKETKDKELAEFEQTLKGESPAHSLDKDEMKAALSGKMSVNKATVSQGDQEGNDPLEDLENPVDPDGEPNFVVKAPSRNQRRNR